LLLKARSIITVGSKTQTRETQTNTETETPAASPHISPPHQ